MNKTTNNHGTSNTTNNGKTMQAQASTPTILSSTKIVAAQDHVEGVTGVQAFWRLSGEVPVGVLAQAVEDAGLAGKVPLPRVPSVARALKRALISVSGGSDKRVMKHPKGGYQTIITDETDDAELDFKKGLRVWWEGDKNEGHLAFSDPYHPGVQNVRKAFAHYREAYTTEDISLWLPYLMQHLDAVSLRPGGGFYFVPAAAVAEYRAWVKAIRSVTSHRLYDNIPAMAVEGMLEAVLDSIVDEVTGIVARTKRDMDAKLQAEKMGKRALKTQQDKLDGLVAKVFKYEEILGRKLPALHAATNGLKSETAKNLLTLMD
jgi:hypothetical protein